MQRHKLLPEQSPKHKVASSQRNTAFSVSSQSVPNQNKNKNNNSSNEMNAHLLEQQRHHEQQHQQLRRPELDLAWYRDSFLSRPHFTFISPPPWSEPSSNPLVVSASLDLSLRFYDIVIHTECGIERVQIPAENVPRSCYRQLLGLPCTIESVISTVKDRLPPRKQLVPCNDPAFATALAEVEDRLILRTFKFGLGFINGDQFTEHHLLVNRLEDASPNFLQFMRFMGEQITLKNWQGYRGGLDTTNNRTGTQSLYTRWSGYEIMFHVAPFLPLDDNDSQCIERKRHIGNDVVVIVFNESSRAFDISTITSKQTHVVVVVRPVIDQASGLECYDVSIVKRREMPDFSPGLPEQTIRLPRQGSAARNYLFTRLVNGERAAFRAPIFESKLQRTRQGLLGMAIQKYLAANKQKNSGGSGAGTGADANSRRVAKQASSSDASASGTTIGSSRNGFTVRPSIQPLQHPPAPPQLPPSARLQPQTQPQTQTQAQAQPQQTPLQPIPPANTAGMADTRRVSYMCKRPSVSSPMMSAYVESPGSGHGSPTQHYKRHSYMATTAVFA